MSTGATPKESLPLTPEQKQTVAGVASTMQIVAGLLLLLGLIQLVGGPVSLIWLGAGFFSAVLTLVQGALTLLLALVMLAASSDFRYLGEYPRFGGNHLRNAAKSLTMFYQVQVGVALVLALIVVVRLLS